MVITPMLALRENLHFCIANERAVFLDLPANRYFCLPRHLDDAFKLSLIDPDGDHATPDQDQLVSLGVFIRSRPGQCPVPPPEMPFAETSIDTSPGWPRLWSLVDSIWCRRAAKGSVATTPLNLLVQMIRDWKSDAARQSNALTPALRADISAFAKSRRFHFSHEQCLSNSIALLHFLRKRGFVPSLVVGVKMSPFAAHAWVQHETVVLADDIDKIRHYTPILVV